MNTAQLDEVIQAVGPDFHGLSYRERLIVGAVLKHLSAPPADDVRELLIEAIDGCIPDDIPGYRQRYTDKAADRILTAFEVRPRGTATDAEHREAVHRAVRAGIESVRSGDADRDVVRAVADQVLALEAAREARS